MMDEHRRMEMTKRAFEGTDNTLGEAWRELVCTQNDLIKGLRVEAAKLREALAARKNLIMQIPGAKDAADPESWAEAWIAESKALWQEVAVVAAVIKRDVEKAAKAVTRRKAREAKSDAEGEQGPSD